MLKKAVVVSAALVMLGAAGALSSVLYTSPGRVGAATSHTIRGRAAQVAASNCAQLASGLGSSVAVEASYASTAGQVASWEAARDGTGTGLFSNDPSSELLSVCFLTGDFGTGKDQAGSAINYGAEIMEILPSGYAVPDVIIHGTTVPSSYGAPGTTSQVERLQHPVS